MNIISKEGYCCCLTSVGVIKYHSVFLNNEGFIIGILPEFGFLYNLTEPVPMEFYKRRDCLITTIKSLEDIDVNELEEVEKVEFFDNIQSYEEIRDMILAVRKCDSYTDDDENSFNFGDDLCAKRVTEAIMSSEFLTEKFIEESVIKIIEEGRNETEK